MKKLILLAWLMLAAGVALSQVTVKSYQTIDSGNWRRDTSSSSTTWKACYMPSLGRDFGYEIFTSDLDSNQIRVAFTYADTAAFASNRAGGFPLPFMGAGQFMRLTFEQVKYGRDTVWVQAPNGTVYYQLKF